VNIKPRGELGRRPCSGLALVAAAMLLLCWNQDAPAEQATPAIAIIIDDLGFRMNEDQAVLGLDQRIGVAVIPNAPQARSVAKQAAAQQRTVLVHLPLAQGPDGDCDAPVCPLREWSSERVRQHLAWAFGEVHGAVGLNNHQGSHFTADPAAIRRLLEGLPLFSLDQPETPFVLDSRTTPGSQLGELAASAGFRTARRDVFLDHDRSPAAMQQAWRAAIELAHRQGQAVVIAHPHPETIEFLDQALAELAEQGIRLVALPEILRRGRSIAPGIGLPAAGAAYRTSIAPPAP